VAAFATGSGVLQERGVGIIIPDSSTGSDANTIQLAESIFSQYVVAFEVTSVLLVVAVVGTVLLARRTKDTVTENPK
jgi:NADH-quinone oxidoreductase subunit J